MDIAKTSMFSSVASSESKINGYFLCRERACLFSYSFRQTGPSPEPIARLIAPLHVEILTDRYFPFLQKIAKRSPPSLSRCEVDLREWEKQSDICGLVGEHMERRVITVRRPLSKIELCRDALMLLLLSIHSVGGFLHQKWSDRVRIQTAVLTRRTYNA